MTTPPTKASKASKATKAPAKTAAKAPAKAPAKTAAKSAVKTAAKAAPAKVSTTKTTQSAAAARVARAKALAAEAAAVAAADEAAEVDEVDEVEVVEEAPVVVTPPPPPLPVRSAPVSTPTPAPSLTPLEQVQRFTSPIGRLVRLVTTIVVLFMVVGLVLKLAGANAGNDIIKWVYDRTSDLADPFKNSFPAKTAKGYAFKNWGLALLVYFAAGRILSRLLGHRPS